MTHEDQESSKYANKSIVARLLYRLFSKHDWLYNNTKTRRWCRVSDRQERKTLKGWSFINQPKRIGFI